MQIYLADSKTILSSLTSLEFVLAECIKEGGFYIGRDPVSVDAPVGPSMVFCTLPSLDELQLPLINQIAAVDKELIPMEKIYLQIQQDAQRSANRFIWAGFFGLSAQFIIMARLTFYELSWVSLTINVGCDGAHCLFLGIRISDIWISILCFI